MTERSAGTDRQSSDPGLSRVAVIRSRDRGDPWPGRGYQLPAARKNELRDLLGRLAQTTGRDDIWDPEIVVDYAAAHDVLRAGWEIGLGAISAEPNGRASLPELVDLLRAMKSFDDRIRDERLRQRDSAFARAREALAQLRRIDATAALVNEAAVAVCNLGFDRAIVSRIEAGHWVPEAVYVGRDAKWAQEILAIGREANLLLDESLPETEMARTGTALLISDVQEREAVNRAVADASMSRSYVAAPIVAHGAVVGFLHADCYYQRRNLDETDRDILAVFGEGLGYALARTAVLDRLDSVRLDLANLAAGVSTAMPAAAWSTNGPAATSTPGRCPARLPPGHAAGRRVGRLDADRAGDRGAARHLAEGDTNARIARRLVVSEGTVKTHVKHILRKLGAANRAEAAARWFQLEHGGVRAPGAARAPAERRNCTVVSSTGWTALGCPQPPAVHRSEEPIDRPGGPGKIRSVRLCRVGGWGPDGYCDFPEPPAHTRTGRGPVRGPRPGNLTWVSEGEDRVGGPVQLAGVVERLGPRQRLLPIGPGRRRGDRPHQVRAHLAGGRRHLVDVAAGGVQGGARTLRRSRCVPPAGQVRVTLCPVPC